MRMTVNAAGFARWSPAPAALQIRGAMTAAAWVTWFDGAPVTIARLGNGADEKWGLSIPGDGSVVWEQYDGSFRSVTVIGAGSMQGRVPAHIAVSRAADGVSLVGYLNGKRVVTAVIAGSMPTANAPASGTIGSSNGSTVAANASVSDLTVWNDVLTAEEIFAASQGYPTPRALVGRWPLATDFRDVGPNGLHMQGIGAVLLPLALR